MSKLTGGQVGILARFIAMFSGNPETVPAFKALGNGLWVASFTNNFEDRHKEILSAESHDRYVARVKAGLVPLPELWHWHTPGTRHGEALWIDKVGNHMVVAVGKFDDTPAGKAAEEQYQKMGPVKLSHGFHYPVWAKKGNVYLDYNTFEITTLPPGREANPFTTFEEVKAMSALSQEIRDSLTTLFGAQAPDVIKQVEAIHEGGEAIRELGTKFKDFGSASDPAANKGNDPATVDVNFANVILKSQADQVDLMGRIMKVVEGFDGRVKTLETLVTDKVKALDDERKKLKSELDLLPSRVEDAVKAAVNDDDEEEDEAKKQLNAQDPNNPANNKQYDPMFPGMNVPMPESSQPAQQ